MKQHQNYMQYHTGRDKMKLKYVVYSKMQKSGKNNNEKLKTNSKIIN